jgi:type II secretory pathway pseudopilin PulG
MVEMMVTFILIGIVLAASTPAFLNYRRTLIRGQTRAMVIEDLRAARQRAVTQHMQVIVGFGNGSATTNLTQYSIHGDTDGDRIRDTGEYWVRKTIPRDSRLHRVTLTPVDTLLFDISGILKPGTMGGTVIVRTGTAYDTLAVTIAGTVYKR